MNRVITATIALLLTLNLSAQTTQFSQKEQNKILKQFTKTFSHNEVELENIENELDNLIETSGMIVEKDFAERLSIDSILIDSIKIIDDASPIVVLIYNSDNQLYTINLNEEETDSFPAMHFFNTIYYGGGIESVVKSSLFTFSFTDQDTIYDVVYEIVNQNGSPIISNRYIQKTPQP